MRWTLMIAWVCVVSFTQGERLRVNLDSDWRFVLGDPPRAQQVAYDDSTWRQLDVPHDWSIEAAFSQTHSPRNAWLPGGIGWYRKTVELPASDAGQHVELQFDGVYKHAEVWVNGVSVGTQYDGYTSFYFDITPQVKFGESNTIAVRVDNSLQPNCRWYTGSGIYRHVWLSVTDSLHVETWGTTITTPEVTESMATVNIRTEVANLGPAVRFELETTVIDGAGQAVATVRSHCAERSLEIEQSLTVADPELWSVDTPNLYTAVSRILVNETVVDEYASPFGIRSLRFDAKQGFFLNGKSMKFKGVCLHAEAGTFGAAVPVEVWKRRLSGLKQVGCNAIRTAHNSMAPEFMELCDRMGLMVMDEFVDKWDDPQFADPFFRSEWQKNFRETIRRDRNHPSVVLWSVGNENHEPGSEEQTASLKTYCDFVRSIDSTRPVVSGMERGKDKDPNEKVDDILRSAQHMDVIGMNYGEQWCRRMAQRNPGKPQISTESYPYYDATEEERWALRERLPWFHVRENDFHMGLFLWVGVSYLGEIPAQGINSWPKIFCWPSAFLDSAGFRTPHSYLYAALWSDQPVVRLAVREKGVEFNKRWGSPPLKESWNLSEETVDLVSYTNCETVELYLNGRKLGTQALSDFPNWILNWENIAVEPGVLCAVGLRNGKAVCRFELKTAAAPAQIQVVPDVETVRSGGIVQVEIQLLDAQDVAVNHDDRELHFEIEGGEIIGLDHGGLTALDAMKETARRATRQGRCLAVLRAGADAAALRLTVRAEGLEPAVGIIPVDSTDPSQCIRTGSSGSAYPGK